MLSIREVAVRFAGVQALAGVSFEARAGRVLGLVGPNGSGKSTLLNVIAGVIVPDGGEIAFDGRPLPVGRPDSVAMRGVARTFQIPRLAKRLSVAQNMIAGARGHPGERLSALLFRPSVVRAYEASVVASALRMLARLELSGLADHPAGGLSGGQQKLLSIGMALMADPQLILLDEPAAGVNPVLVAQQIRLLEDLAREGRTVLLIEHNMEMVADLCDEVIVLDAGVIIARGAPAEIRRDPYVMRSYLGEIA